LRGVLYRGNLVQFTLKGNLTQHKFTNVKSINDNGYKINQTLIVLIYRINTIVRSDKRIAEQATKNHCVR